MIIRGKPGPLGLLFAARGPVLPRSLPRIAFVTVIACEVVAVDRYHTVLPHTNAAPFAVFGIALRAFAKWLAATGHAQAGCAQIAIISVKR